MKTVKKKKEDGLRANLHPAVGLKISGVSLHCPLRGRAAADMCVIYF